MGLPQERQPERIPTVLPFSMDSTRIVKLAIKEAREDKSTFVSYLRLVGVIIRDPSVMRMFPEDDVEKLRFAHITRRVSRSFDSVGEPSGKPAFDSQALSLIFSANEIARQIGRKEITPLDLYSAHLREERRRVEEIKLKIEAKDILSSLKNELSNQTYTNFFRNAIEELRENNKKNPKK